MDTNELKVEYEKFLSELRATSTAARVAAEKARHKLASHIATYHESQPNISTTERAVHFQKINAAQEDMAKALKLWIELDDRLKAYEPTFNRNFGSDT